MSDKTFRCPNCNARYDDATAIVPREDKPYYCVECSIPMSDLREVASEFESRDWMTQEGNLAARDCAEDLREVIKEYAGTEDDK